MVTIAETILETAPLNLFTMAQKSSLILKKFTNIFQDPQFKEFFTIGLFKKQVEDEFEQKLEQLDVHDEFYPALLES